MPNFGVPKEWTAQKQAYQKQKIPTKSTHSRFIQNLNQVKNKEPLARCKSMNTTPT